MFYRRRWSGAVFAGYCTTCTPTLRCAVCKVLHPRAHTVRGSASRGCSCARLALHLVSALPSSDRHAALRARECTGRTNMRSAHAKQDNNNLCILQSTHRPDPVLYSMVPCMLASGGLHHGARSRSKGAHGSCQPLRGRHSTHLVGLDVGLPKLQVEAPHAHGRQREHVVEQGPQLLLAKACTHTDVNVGTDLLSSMPFTMPGVSGRVPKRAVKTPVCMPPPGLACIRTVAAVSLAADWTSCGCLPGKPSASDQAVWG